MKRFFAFIICIVLAFGASAIAEGDGFVKGGVAAKAGDEYFIRVDEGDTDALVRVSGGKAYLSLRADEIGSMLADAGVLYYLKRTGDIWELAARSGGSEWTMLTFDEGVHASCLGARDGKLFVLLDGALHIIYPKQLQCFKLVSAPMNDYALNGDRAYYISADGLTGHRLASPDGNIAEATVGKLCAVELSTGHKTVLIAEGVSDMDCLDGQLYFHNYADRYLAGEGEDMTIEGRLYSYDMTGGTMKKLVKGYDWEYHLTGSGVVIRREKGLVAVKGAESILEMPADAQCAYAGDAFVWYDGEFRVSTYGE